MPVAEKRPTMPRMVWILGFVSLSMDLSSEMIHSLLPLFLTTTLGVSVGMVGLIDGIGEATAAVTKVFSGYISDRIGRRKPLLLLGYGLAGLSKPLFAIAGSPGVVLGARFIDRIGKGLRGAPRDALVADVTPLDIRGRAFGLRQSLDTVGAFIGPLAAVVLMVVFADRIRSVFWVAVIPGVMATLLVLFGVRARRHGFEGVDARVPLRLTDLRRLDRSFWSVVGIGVLFTMARFSEAFLILRANAEGLPIALAPLALVAMNLVYSLGAYPAGALADERGPFRPLVFGLASLVAADLLLAYGHGLAITFVGIGLWGAHMALTQGLMSKLVAERAPETLRGSAFGLFNLATGVTLLAASVVAGLLWDTLGAPATFLAGAGFAALTMLSLIPRQTVAPREADGSTGN